MTRAATSTAPTSTAPTSTTASARANEVADDRGSITAWLLVLPLLLAVVAGFGLDLWAGLATRSRIAAIADDAAAAGASALDLASLRAGTAEVRLDPPAAEARALAAVDAHPEAGAVTGRTATASPDRITVTVEGRHDPILLHLVGAGAIPVRVTGHAAPRPGG